MDGIPQAASHSAGLPAAAIIGGMRQTPIDRLRTICLALPEAAEKETWETPTFRVREKIFAMAREGDGRVALWCKAPSGSQAVLVGADPARFFVPSYVGHKGWVGMWLDKKPDWDEVALLVRRSYRLVAPKRLAARAD
jgi:predicted DNA-binding protein (MmcQ/YjbR family)